MSSQAGRLRPFSVLLAVAGFAVVSALPVATQPQRRARRHVWLENREVVDGDVLVKYREQRSADQAVQIEAAADADESEPIDRRGMRRLHSRRYGTAELLRTLRMNPDVEYAEPNYVLRLATTPNDPSFTNLWGLFNTGFNTVGGGGVAGSDIDILSVWDYTTGSRANVIGVIDTGVDYNHPDLAANIWSAPTQFQVTIGGQTITCGAGTHGFNAITRTCDPMDDQYHGTHVSGTIGAVGNNTVGLAGVNWATSIMGLKFLGSTGSGSTADAVAAIEFAIQAKAHFGTSANIRVLSNSWGGGGGTALLNAINSANANDMLFVVAAGNNNVDIDVNPTYPAAYTAANLVTVAASDNRDGRASFSNYGATKVHLAAPGTSIYSTFPSNSYSTIQGTSMATPHVSGAAGLVLAGCNADTATLRALLLNSVDIVQAFAGITTTGGRLNVARAFQNCTARKVTALTQSVDKPAPQAPSTTITFTATATWGQAPLQYRWLVFDGTTWTPTAWSTSATYAWTPAQQNSGYQVQAQARSAWNAGSAEAVSATMSYPVQPRVSGVTVTPSVSSPQGLGASIGWTAAASGGVAPYQYKWSISNGTTTTVLADWSSTTTYTWVPAVAGTYVLTVKARGAGNTGSNEASADVSFVIKPRVTAVSFTVDKAAPQEPNTAITLTASATGGEAPLQYRFYLYDGTAWTMSNWSTSATYTWTPTQGNASYQIQMRARSAWNAAGAEAISAAMPFPIQARVSSVALSPNMSSPQGVGATVTWTATPTGGIGPYQYKWSVSNGTTTTLLADWGSASTYSWTPVVGDYVVTVKVRGAGNTGSYEALADVSFAIKPKVSAVSFTVDKSAPQEPNTAITLTASATGGEAPLQYRFYLYDGATWTMSNWSTSATYTWTPTQTNSAYQIQMRARSAWSSAGAEAISATMAYPIQARVSSVALSPNMSSPQGVGATITWTATPTGGVGPYQYKWSVSNGTTTTLLADWSSASTYNWTPTVGNYVVTAKVRGAGNTGSYEAVADVSFAIKPKVSAVSFTVDKSAPQEPNTAITLTASATGGEAPLQYRFYLYDGTTWTMSNWSTSATYTWTPTQTNSAYQIQMRARSAWSSAGAEAISATMAYPIQARVSSVALSPNMSSPQGVGATVTWTAAPAGGIAPYQYKWSVSDGTTTTLLADWSSANTYSWTPAVGNYVVTVKVRGAGNTGSYESVADVSFAIKPKVSAVSFTVDKVAPQVPNTAITLTASGIGGEAPLQYRFYVYDGTTWTMSNWSTSATYTWTPTQASSAYQIQMRARSAWSSAGAEAISAAMAYPIQARVSDLALSPAASSPQTVGAAVTWTATATDGLAPYQYKWSISDGTTITLLADWSSGDSYTWTPTVAATYTVTAKVRSANNTGSYEAIATETFVAGP